MLGFQAMFRIYGLRCGFSRSGMVVCGRVEGVRVFG